MKATITRTIEIEVYDDRATEQELINAFDDYMEQSMDHPWGNVFRWNKDTKECEDFGEISVNSYNTPDPDEIKLSQAAWDMFYEAARRCGFVDLIGEDWNEARDEELREKTAEISLKFDAMLKALEESQ